MSPRLKLILGLNVASTIGGLIAAGIHAGKPVAGAFIIMAIIALMTVEHLAGVRRD